MPWVHALVLVLSWSTTSCQWQCLSSHVGPYLVLPALTSGLHNQWLLLHSGLFAAMRWTKSTGGTVILPASALVRKTFRGKDPIFTAVPSDSMFDTGFLCSHLNASGVHACIPDPAFLAGLQHSRPQVALPPQKFNMFRDPGRPVGWDPFNTILGVRTQLGGPTGARVNASVVVRLPSNFGGAHVPHDTTDYYAWQLVYAREAAIGIRFSAALRTLARTLLGRVPAGPELIAVHLRLEEDWPLAQAGHLQPLLDQYTAQLTRVVNGLLGRPYALYLSAGAMPRAAQQMVAQLLGRFPAPVYTKASFLSAAELRSVSVEQQAAVDAEVAVAAAHFVGCAYSSWSYVVAERRGFHGRPSLMAQRPGPWGWHPIFVPPTERWRAVMDTKRLPSAGKAQKVQRWQPLTVIAPAPGGPLDSGAHSPPSPVPDPSPQPHVNGSKLFEQIATGPRQALSDKVTLHCYQHMYGLLLLPLLPASPSALPGRPLRVLRLGLGCDAAHRPHGNAFSWASVLPTGSSLTVVDPDVACVNRARERPSEGSTHVRSILTSGTPPPAGPFDVILDDGNPHTPSPLGPGLPQLVGALLAPGGRYFAEAAPHRAVLPGALPLLAVLAAWAQRLALPPTSEVDLPAQLLLEECPLPDSVRWLLFQAEGCAVVRCPAAAEVCQRAPARPVLSPPSAGSPSGPPLDLYDLLVAPLLRSWPTVQPGRRLRLLAAGAVGNTPPAAVAEVWTMGAGRADGAATPATLEGDPCDAAAVGRWLQRVGGPFDVIVDGGVADFPRHFPCLFDGGLLPGGLYVFEGDLGRSVRRGIGLVHVLASWAAQLGTPLDKAVGDAAAELLARRFPLPPAAKWLLLQRGAAALAKCEAPDVRACRPVRLD